MKAIVRIGGQQFMVAEKDTLLVDRLPEGTKELTLEPLMIVDGKDSKVGAPVVAGVKIKAKVLDEEVKGDKVLSIRYKSKKRVHKVRGHRQKYSRIEVGKIGATKPAAKK
ncbi:MAG TPA: 50S ribosomal protein L21 [Candidatus Saccharimonadales bacterium]|nr:50S ribosomal protein L21 [Candidatus Saccharimonadales bacterium]